MTNKSDASNKKRSSAMCGLTSTALYKYGYRDITVTDANNTSFHSDEGSGIQEQS